MHIYTLAFFLAIALAFARPSLATPLLSAHEVDVELEDLDISLEPATYAHTRQLSATCRRWKSRQYYSTKNLLEEIDITGKNRDKSCCWYCSKTCGCKKWDYEKLKDGTEVCKLFDNKARWKKYSGSGRHYGGKVN